MSQWDLPFDEDDEEPGFRMIKPTITAEELRDEVERILQSSKLADLIRIRKCVALEAWEEECLRQRGVEIIRSKHLC